MDIPIREIRITLGILARDLVAHKWERFYDQATIHDTAIIHKEAIQDRLCRELDILWANSKPRWFFNYAFSIANVRIEIDTAKIADNGSCLAQTLYMDRDFTLDGSVSLEDMGQHITTCFQLIFPKFLDEVGRKVYVPRGVL